MFLRYVAVAAVAAGCFASEVPSERELQRLRLEASRMQAEAQRIAQESGAMRQLAVQAQEMARQLAQVEMAWLHQPGPNLNPDLDFDFDFDPQGVPAPPAPPNPPSVRILGSGSYLGVAVQEIDAGRAKELKMTEERGVEITNIVDDSPAAKAGLQKGDVVLEYQGQRVEGIEQFMRFVRETPPGRNVRLLISRGGQSRTITASVGARPGRLRDVTMVGPAWNMPEVWIPDVPRPNMSWRSSMLGLEGEALEGQLAGFFGVKKGVLVRSVVAGSAAEKAGLKAGDVITKVDQSAVDSPRELTEALREERTKTSVALTLVRERKEMSLNVAVDPERMRGGETRTRVRSVRVR